MTSRPPSSPRHEIREQLAEELLVTGGLSVAEVAGRLGYREVSSFSQAFRRGKGVGPRAYRMGAITSARSFGIKRI